MSSNHYSATIPSVTVDGSAVADSEAIKYGAYASGSIYVPAGSSMTTLTWFACETVDGTYLAAEDAASAAVTQTVAASQSHPIPVALAGARFIKATANASGVMGVTLKD